MVDIHCHILPCVDDGAGSMSDALLMARMAADSGVSALIATPHCGIPGAPRANLRSSELSARFSEFRASVRKAGIPLDIFQGAEIFCTRDTPSLLDAGRLSSLAGTKYMLMEFDFGETASFMESMFADFFSRGFIPVAAHPERYEAVQHAPEMLFRWFDMGCVIQLNKGSILGALGRRAGQTAHWALHRGLAHAAASDAHSPGERTTRLSGLRDYLTDEISPDCADILLERNPSLILRGEPLLPPEG